MPTRLSLVLMLTLSAGCGSTQAAVASPAAAEGPSEPAASSSAPSTTTSTTSTSTSTSTSTAGDPLARYARDVMAVVSRHWAIPQTIPREVATHLEARIQIDVDANQMPTAARIVEGSGNATFDESVTRALADVVLAHEALPPPPSGLDEHGVVRLRLRGR